MRDAAGPPGQGECGFCQRGELRFDCDWAQRPLGAVGPAAGRHGRPGERPRALQRVDRQTAGEIAGITEDGKTGAKTMTTIKDITALEILDSRGNPTVMVSVALNNGITASAGVPSGASTGIREAVELRDGDEKRYGGKGVLRAVANVNKVIAPKVKGKSPHAQQEIDDLMRKLDGTDTKAKLGANAILGVSMAVCRAAALDAGMPLYAYIRKLHGGRASAPYLLPAPM